MILLRSQPFAHPAERLGRLQRLSAVLLGLTILLVWDPVARPGPRLCLLRHAVGLPCPLCGLTRGVSSGLRGRFLEAAIFNPLALLVLAAAVVLGVKWGAEYAIGRRLEVAAPRRIKRAALAVVYVVLLAAWIYLLVYRREDDFAACWLGRLLR
jgi:hypothetical protein